MDHSDCEQDGATTRGVPEKTVSRVGHPSHDCLAGGSSLMKLVAVVCLFMASRAQRVVTCPLLLGHACMSPYAGNGFGHCDVRGGCPGTGRPLTSERRENNAERQRLFRCSLEGSTTLITSKHHPEYLRKSGLCFPRSHTATIPPRVPACGVRGRAVRTCNVLPKTH